MILTELFVFSVCVLIGVGGYRLGRHDGYKKGWFAGHQDATMKFLPSSHVRVTEVYDHKKAGI